MTLKDRLLALAIVVIWGVNFVVIKQGLVGMPPFLLAGMRFLLVAVPAIFFIPRPRVPLKWMCIYAMTISFGQFAFLFSAIKIGMPAGLASLVLQSQAFFTILLGALLMREALKLNQVIGLFIASAGVVLIASGGVSADGLEQVPLFGFLLTIGAAASWALGNISNKVISSSTEKQGVMPLVVWSALIPVLPFFVCSWLFEGPQLIHASLWQIDSTTILALIYLSFASTIFGYTAWGQLLTRYETWRVAPLTLLVPIVGMLAAWLFLDEVLNLRQIAGSALVMMGLVVNIFGVFGLLIRRKMA